MERILAKLAPSAWSNFLLNAELKNVFFLQNLNSMCRVNMYSWSDERFVERYLMKNRAALYFLTAKHPITLN